MSNELPLSGMRVLEIGGGVPAAFATRFLAGYGADVVRSEGASGAVDGAVDSELGVDEALAATGDCAPLRLVVPGWSGTPRTVMRATSVSLAMPRTLFPCSMKGPP